MSDIGRDEIVAVLFGDEDHYIREQFFGNYSDELEQFVVLMAQAFEEWSRVDQILLKKNVITSYSIHYTKLYDYQ